MIGETSNICQWPTVRQWQNVKSELAGRKDGEGWRRIQYTEVVSIMWGLGSRGGAMAEEAMYNTPSGGARWRAWMQEIG